MRSVLDGAAEQGQVPNGRCKQAAEHGPGGEEHEAKVDFHIHSCFPLSYNLGVDRDVPQPTPITTFLLMKGKVMIVPEFQTLYTCPRCKEQFLDYIKQPRKYCSLECYRPNPPIAEWFRENINDTFEPNGCRLWTGRRNESGYGYSKHRLAHRVSYEISYGPIPEGLCVLHECDNPPCINPEHLFLGTRPENTIDCVKKGRHAYAKLTEEAVLAIRRDYRPKTIGCAKRLAIEHGVSIPCIYKIASGEIWKHLLPQNDSSNKIAFDPSEATSK
jgi:HNH endonuclease